MQPSQRFKEWLDAAAATGMRDPNAMCLATADAAGQPSARIVLLKELDDRGYVFYTNLDSRKSRELRQNPKASLCFYWPSLGRQVRVEGVIEQVSNAEADAYFATRPRESRIGAWSSQQSQPLESREALMRVVEENTRRFEGQDVPRPEHWSGWRLLPHKVEFWQEAPFRLHDREVFTLQDGNWSITRLYP